MSGKGKRNQRRAANKNKNDVNAEQDEIEDGASSTELTEDDEELTTAQAIMSLSNNIIEMKDELKQELASLKSEMNQKLQNVTVDVRNQGTRLTEAEQRVNELETVNTDMREALLHCLSQQKSLQAKVTELEGRSRRNNIRIYGIREGNEKDDMEAFVNHFLKKELAIGEDVDLQIQRAHRSLAPKPKDEQAAPRSIVINFQRFDIKNKVLRKAWAKKIVHDGKVISFAHDMPTEIYNKLKEYKDMKKMLKEAKIRFQTPYPGRMRIHWEDGPCLYKNATEVASEMMKRGYRVEAPRAVAGVDWEQALTEGAHWDRTDETHSDRVRGRLREFHRAPVQST